MAINRFKSMKLAAIYNVWADGLDLLKPSVENILPVVDEVIIVFSSYSNYGHYIPFTCLDPHEKIQYVNCEPNRNNPPHQNEIDKRNLGLNCAKEQDFTHFLNMDADEFYQQDEFLTEKNFIEKNNVAGMVCGIKVYFKSPTLTVGFDHTLVPFIHKLTPELKFVLNNKSYPFAYDDTGNAHIDPTRRLNLYSNILFSNVVMHHYSWLRSDYNLKIENSAARNNLRKSSIYKDLEDAAPGVYNQFYRKELTECANIFNLPEYETK
jgi:hypothetical protein